MKPKTEEDASTGTPEEGVSAEAHGEGASKRRRRLLDELNSGHNHAAVCADREEDLDRTRPGWWLPQPRATLSPDELQERPAAPLARALACVLCRGLLAEAMTVPECCHTFCYDCIESRVEIGGNRNVCPAPGCDTVLGPTPFDHHRVLYDSVLDELVQKIFPRPALDAALAARRAEREEATREARAACNAGGRSAGRSLSPPPAAEGQGQGEEEEEGAEEGEGRAAAMEAEMSHGSPGTRSGHRRGRGR